MTETAQTKGGRDGKSVSAIAMDRLESKGGTFGERRPHWGSISAVLDGGRNH